ncbi:MAG: Appr-1-p processing protein, partial [Puniceicoccaceae bacterium]
VANTHNFQMTTPDTQYQQKLNKLDIPVEIYAPYGTSKKLITTDFLDSELQGEFLVKGKRREKLRPEWAALVEVLSQLEAQPYANPVGRVIFQKICYIMTKLGLDTGFQFERNSYGPYANEVKEAISVLANKNWVVETQLGKMTAIKVGPAYPKDRKEYHSQIQQFRSKIEKTVDLFSRIKNTDQAEEIATVIFAVQKLKSERATEKDTVSEQDLFNYILEWKKPWQKNEQKRVNLAETIRNLEMLSWVKLSFSESLPTPSDAAAVA